MINYEQSVARINERISVDEYQIWNATKTKMRIAFMNKAITDGKTQYYKMLFWFKDKDYSILRDFKFQLQIKSPTNLIPVEVMEYNSNFIVGDDSYIEVHISAPNLKEHSTFIYNFTHNGLEGQGQISLNLSINDLGNIDNELMVFENDRCESLFDKSVNVSIPNFELSKRYKVLLKFQINIIDLASWKYNYLSPINEMILIVDNNIWSDPIIINEFKINISGDSAKKYYDFNPIISLVDDELVMDNSLLLDPLSNIVTDSGDEKGIIFNPYCLTQQFLSFNLSIYGQKWAKNVIIQTTRINYVYFPDVLEYLVKTVIIDEA